MEFIACLAILLGFGLLFGFNMISLVSSSILIIGGFILLKLIDIHKELKRINEVKNLNREQ